MRHLFLSLALTASFTLTAANDETRLLRFPATNGTDVVFSYGGDLYTAPISGGEAKRLTSHIGYEMFARFSPDGSTIAFTGEYDGNREVYTIPSNGGVPVRITYTATNGRDDLGDRMGPNNIVMGWTRDGGNIIYRNRISDGFAGNLWTVSPKGGMPAKLPLPEGGFCSYSPDGTKLAYNRVMREFRTWKYYRGGMADDIWIYDAKASKVTRITENDAQDIFPMWIGDEIYFASDRDMTMNLFCYNTVTGATTKVTDFKEYDIKFPSSNGSLIVFENGGYIYKFDPSTKKTSKITITLTSDNIYGRSERRDVSDNINAYSASPDGKFAAITARGEVFIAPAGKGVTRNITRTPGSNDRDAIWSPDGKYLAYIGDGTGESEIYIYDNENGSTRQLTKGNDSYILGFSWTPDSKTIITSDRKNRSIAVDVTTGKKKVVLQCPEAPFYSVNISPDSKWLTYTRPAKNQMSVLYLYNVASGKEYPVTTDWYDSGNAIFSSDSRYIIFTADRDLNPIYSRTEWNAAYGSMSAVYMAVLSPDTPSPFIIGAEKQEGDAPAINPEGIGDRIIKLDIQGSAYPRWCDGNKLIYSAGRETKIFDFSTGKSDTWCDAPVGIDTGIDYAVVRKGDSMSITKLGGSKAAPGENIDLSDLYADIDFSAEWAQLFDEVWRAYRDGFYLENMHGVDWNAIKKKYAAFLPYASTRLDVNYIIGEMISELAVGHAYVNTGEKPEAPRVKMGLLGAELSRDKSGYFRIDRILQGETYSKTLRSPLTEPGLGVEAGSFITAVNGIPTNTVSNIYQLLIGKADVLTELTINSAAKEGGRKVTIRPIDDEYPLYHLEWVKGNIKKVEEATKGRVGYIYIPDMGREGLNEFVRYYYPQLDKEALIIDDRANGGGNVSPMIIERLKREVYRMTMRRGSTLNGTIPDGTHTGPKVLLINKYSASDGDLFPWSFKANNLGTVIGTRTWGGIVGISGSLPYIDGTDVRVPFFTNYDAKTGNWIVENHGVDPDILIDNDPVLEAAGTDQQLNKAIEVALEQLKTRKPLPSTPAPRTFKDLGL